MIIGLGRRKEASAKVQLLQGSGKIIINEKDIDSYVQKNFIHRSIVYKPLENLGLINNYDIIVHVRGSGIKGQMEAVQLSITRALCKLNSSYKIILKTKGFLKRDSRSKERRKYGLKKARKAPQFSKR